MQSETSTTHRPPPARRRGFGSLAAVSGIALCIAAGSAAPALAQATMRPRPSPQSPAQPVHPAPATKSHDGHGHDFSHKSSTIWRSSVVVQSGGVTFVTGSGSFWHGSSWNHGWGHSWCDGVGWGGVGFFEPYAVFYGSSGLRQIGPTFDELRTFVPGQSGRGGLIIAPEPPRVPTPAERLASALRDRSYDEAQALARQQGDGRREAFALLGRGQADEAAELFARTYRANPELFNEPFRADDWFASREETRRLLSLAVRHAHRERTAEAWFLVAAIMRAEGRDQLADDMMDRAREAERQQRGVVPREPAPATPAAPVPTTPSTTPSTTPATVTPPVQTPPQAPAQPPVPPQPPTADPPGPAPAQPATDEPAAT